MSDYTSPKTKRTIRPFEVIQVDEKKVVVHTGVILDFGNIVQPRSNDFISDAKPQDITQSLSSDLFLDVEDKDFVCLKISKEKPLGLYLVSLDNQELTEVRAGGMYKVLILAKILSIDEETKTLEIEYRYKDDLAYQSTFFPPFTPILWEPEIDSAADQTDAWFEEIMGRSTKKTLHAIFIPGSLHLSHIPYFEADQTTKKGGNPQVFTIKGVGLEEEEVNSSMLEFPIMVVTADQSWYVEMPLNTSWTINGDIIFSSVMPTMLPSEKNYVIGENPCPTATLAGECEEQDARYWFKVLEFLEGDGDKIYPEIYWRSDYIIHKNPRCHTCEGSGEPPGESGTSGALNFLNCSGDTVYSLEWEESLIKNDGVTSIQLGNCASGSGVISGDTGTIYIVENGTTGTLIEANNGLVSSISERTLYARDIDVCVSGSVQTFTFLTLS